MHAARFLVGTTLAAATFAQTPTSLPEVTVYSARVANQAPGGTFAMPVSLLRFEPGVDIQSRNLAEGQADVTARGGIFENTGFQLGSVTVLDPQTGHYAAELPVAPSLLTPASVQTGAGLALSATNATVAAVSYGWRPVRTAGAAGVGLGEFGLRRAEVYQGYAARPGIGGRRLGFDVALAHSESDGSLPFGEHTFDRANLRLQFATAHAQTDLFAGYQGKRFGWPNLYTPFNSKETENLQTTLFAINHRADLGDDQMFEAGAYHRRNKDDYAFDRFALLGRRHPFQHTTWTSGAGATARRRIGAIVYSGRAEVSADEIASTSLTFGRYQTRTLTKAALMAAKPWMFANGRTETKIGVVYDDSNRAGAALSPVVELSREFASARVRRVHVSYTRTTQLPTYTALNSSPSAGLFRGNRTLGREHTANVEAGISGSLAGWNTLGTVFWRRQDALVDWTFRRSASAARTANAVDVAVGGVEVLARRSWTACDVVLGYTALAKDADYRGAAVDASFYALNYARHRLTAAVTLRLGRGVELRMDNVARVQADNALRTQGGDEALSTALGILYHPVAWRRVELALQVENVWDSRYQDVPAVPAAPRQVSAGVSYLW